MLTGGGSGGPTTPLIALHEELSQQLEGASLETLFLGTAEGPEEQMLRSTSIEFQAIPSGKLRRYWHWKNFIDPFFVIAGFFYGLYWIRKFKPDVVVSAGSFVSVPVAYAAWLLRVPHVIFQMDVKPGLANRLMGPVSEVLTYLFEQTAGYFKTARQYRIGPVLRSVMDAPQPELTSLQFDLHSRKPVLLITGGGQGSVALNEATGQCMDILLERFQIIHLTGKSNPPMNTSHPDYHALPFVAEGMGNILARCDLILSRAGLGMITEAAHLNKDLVLVPIPNSHQMQNAQAVIERGGAVLLHQDDFLSTGKQWWKSFLSEYQPGTLGQKLYQVFLTQGRCQFAKIILQTARGTL